MNVLLITITSLIVLISVWLFGYLVTVVVTTLGVTFAICIVLKSLLINFLTVNSLATINEPVKTDLKNHKGDLLWKQ